MECLGCCLKLFYILITVSEVSRSSHFILMKVIIYSQIWLLHLCSALLHSIFNPLGTKCVTLL